jgi:Tol biopolymer transport system component
MTNLRFRIKAIKDYTKKPTFDKKKSPIYIVVSVLLLILFVSNIALPQRSYYRGRSRELDDPNLPEQRTPFAKSELKLRDIPYKIVYESFLETDGIDNWEICLIDADGSNWVNLTNTPNINEFYPHASPDGTKICFVAVEGDSWEDRSRNIYYMDTKGSNLTKIAENAYQPCWSGDGQQIAYLKGEYSRYSSSSWSNRGIAICDLKTKKSKSHPNQEIGLLFNLCWSLDGNWFTATSRARGRGGSNLVFGADDRTTKTLNIRGCRPDISPDGQQVAWGRTDHVLEIGDLDFSSSSDIVTNQTPVIACHQDYKVYHVDWSPNGRYLTFSYGPRSGDQAVGRKAAGWNICVYDFETGIWVQITSDGQHNKEPDWVSVRF